MTPVIVTREELIVVGLRTVIELGAAADLSIWTDKLLPRRDEIRAVEKRFYCVFNPLPGDDKGDRYEYVAGMVTNSLEDIPVGMVGWVIPAGNYAEVDAPGKTGIGETGRYLIADWLPDSGYRMVATPMFAYTESEHPDNPDAVWKVNIPVETPETLEALQNWLQ